MNRKSLAILAMGVILGTGGAAHALVFDAMMSETLKDINGNPITYNGNAANGTPTPQMTGTNMDFYKVVNTLNTNLNASTTLGTPSTTPLTRNEQLDTALISTNSSFNSEKASQISFVILGSAAMNTNKLGYYLRTPETSNPSIVKYPSVGSTGQDFSMYGSGTAADPFNKVANFVAPANTMGWYIDSTDWRTGKTTTYYSEAFLNADGYDHLIGYALPELAGLTYTYADPSGGTLTHTFGANAMLIGFKDRSATASYNPLHPEYGTTLGDDDYNDVLILVDSSIITPSIKAPLVPEPATIVLVGAGLAGLLVVRRRSRN